VAVLAASSCGFPDHHFIADDEFYGKANPSGGSGGADASVGVGGSSGTSVAAGGGVGAGGARSSGGGSSIGGAFDSGTTQHIEGGRPKPDGGYSGQPGAGGAFDGGPEGGDSGPVCGPGLTSCSGTCVDLLSDNGHCGDCKTVCAGSDVCTKGSCAAPCTSGLTECSGVCVDLTSDSNNCSKCGTACPPGFVCDQSTCKVACDTGSRCGSATICYDIQTDPTHCGASCTPCSPGQLCSGGTCKTQCTAPFDACGSNTCYNLQSDDQHCGDCATKCTAQQACQGGQCKTLVEDCQNGVDDDRDNLVDCADPDCSAFTCASTPSGWTGPIAIWAGTAGTGPSCSASGGYASELLSAHDGLSAPGYTCPGCTCTPSSDAACSALTFWYDTTTTCSSSTAWTVNVTPDGQCHAVTLGQANPSARSSQLIPPVSSYISGSCVGSQPPPKFPAASWSTDVRGCGGLTTNGGGCTVGQCLPKPAAPFGAKLCIFKSGITSCPLEYPVQKPAASTQYYETWTEGRTCSQCSCSQPKCGGTVHTYTDTACTTDDTVAAIDGSCTTIPADPTQSSRADTRSTKWVNAGPVCGNVTSTLSGAPQPDSPVTVCCQN
jgi:hypothetical protein